MLTSADSERSSSTRVETPMPVPPVGVSPQGEESL